MGNAKVVSAGAEWRQGLPLVLAAAAGMSLSAIPSASLGVMMAPIEQDLGWTRTQISMGTSLVALVAVALGALAGLAIDRFGARRIGLAAAFLMCGGIALMATVGAAVWQWWSLWALVGVAGAAMPTVWISPVSRRFVARRGLAVAIALSGTGVSTSLVPILANSLVEQHGWRTAYDILAGLWAAVVFPLVFLFFRASAPADGAGPDRKAPAGPQPGLTAREGFTSITFYKLAFAAFLSMSAGVALILNLVPVLRSTGLTPAVAASIAGIIGIATITGRIIGGFLMDRMSAKAIAALSAGGAVVLPVALLAFPGSPLAAAGAVLVYGLLGGAKVPALVYLASRHFGARAFGVLYGTVNTMVALGVGLGPVVANYVYDVTRSYTPVMWTAVPFLLAAALLYASLGRYPTFAAPPACKPADAAGRSGK